MPRAYKFHKLSRDAKDRVRQWLWESDFDWWDCTIEDFKIVAAALGFETSTRSSTYDAKGPDGKFNGKKATRTDDEIFFSDNYGWRAGFNGRWRATDAIGARKKVEEHCSDEVLLKLADEMEAGLAKCCVAGMDKIIREQGLYYEARGDADGQARDGHLGWETDAPLDDTQETIIHDLRDTVNDVAQRLSRWLAKQLEAEAEYRQSEEAVKETCEANEYLFDEHGDML